MSNTTETKAQHTPGPWTVHPDWPCVVVPETDAHKHLGGAADPEVEAAEYVKKIAWEDGSKFPEFHRSRVMPGEAEANARLIAAAPDFDAATKTAIAGHVNEGDYVSIPRTAYAMLCDAYSKAHPASAKGGR
jgi:hypothetical protein